MRVLLVGYGKMGQMKAPIWKSLGADVYVHELKSTLKSLISEDGYNLASQMPIGGDDDIIIDITTPAGTHVSALKWTLDYIKAAPKRILLEKPVVSSVTELKDLQDLIDTENSIDLLDITYVNESYNSSAVLQNVKRAISARGERVTSIKIDLSKNRLSDNDMGRFFDYGLGAVGIEMPHMVAILQHFGIDTTALAQQSPTLYIDKSRYDNQGVAVAFDNLGTKVELLSYLGNYRYDGDTQITNDGIRRTLEIKTSGHSYKVIFDPAPGVPRFSARLISAKDSTILKDEIMGDNHLEAHLRSIAGKEKPFIDNDLSTLANGLLISETLLALKENCNQKKIDLASKPTTRLDSTMHFDKLAK